MTMSLWWLSEILLNQSLVPWKDVSQILLSCLLPARVWITGKFSVEFSFHKCILLSDSRVTVSRETICPSRPGIKALQQKSSLLMECPWARLYILIHFRDMALVTLFQMQVKGEMYLFLHQRLEWGWLILDSIIYACQLIYKWCRQETKFRQCITKIVYSGQPVITLPKWTPFHKVTHIIYGGRTLVSFTQQSITKINTNWLNSTNVF